MNSYSIYRVEWTTRCGIAHHIVSRSYVHFPFLQSSDKSRRVHIVLKLRNHWLRSGVEPETSLKAEYYRSGKLGAVNKCIMYLSLAMEFNVTGVTILFWDSVLWNGAAMFVTELSHGLPPTQSDRHIVFSSYVALNDISIEKNIKQNWQLDHRFAAFSNVYLFALKKKKDHYKRQWNSGWNSWRHTWLRHLKSSKEKKSKLMVSFEVT